MSRNFPNKYDQLSSQFTEREYKAPATYFGHRLEIIRTWGPPLQEGDSILHIGCGDGYLTRMLADKGYKVHACDLSEGMLHQTQKRCSGLPVTTSLCDVNRPETLDGPPVDCIVAIMRSFFHYCELPQTTLQTLHRRARKKLIIDVDPREYSVRDATRALKQSGFSNVQMRAFLAPQTQVLPNCLQRFLFKMETVSWFYKPLLWKKFHLLLLGHADER